MSQDFNTTSRKVRRTGRGNRSRPTLVTPTSPEQDEQSNDIQETTTSSSTPVQELPPLVVPTSAPTPPKGRRLPGFLPALGKSSKDEAQAKEVKEIDPALARLARATRKIPAVASKNAVPKAQNQEKEQTAAKPARTTTSTSTGKPASTRPATPFKTRYIFGMVLYLLCANFIGVFETSILQSYHLDAVLTTFNLFGGNIIVRTSTLVFLATLVIILIILARLDLIPRSLGAATGASTSKSSTASSRNSDGERAPQPTMRQGVKGESDDLYQQYRSSQRRQKK